MRRLAQMRPGSWCRPHNLAVLAFLMIGVIWAYSTPPGAAGDEESHFVRMVALGRGQLLGADRPVDMPAGSKTGRALDE